jgi:D-cysteine desulfhydrase
MPLPSQLHILVPYSAPTWTSTWLRPPPTRRYLLGALPTPVHRWRLPATEGLLDLWIKRDDMTGSVLSGNKVRKLEFLFAEALTGGGGRPQAADTTPAVAPPQAPTLITVGALQSNHARATAAAAREAGLECHLILRASEAVAAAADPGLAGNLLVDRLTGAHLHLVSKSEYAAHGGPGLTARLAERLQRETGARPYVIPVGGSNATGAWGYVEAVTELMDGVPGEGGGAAAQSTPWDDVVVACGSGGTVAGLAAGIAAAGLPARLHACGVCDDPAYFEAFIRDEHLVPMGVPGAAAIAASIHYLQAKGAGYGISRPAELATCASVAASTGILCDGTYVGKALHAFVESVAANPGAWRGRKVLFLHTGGLLSMGDQAGGFEGGVRALGRVQRMRL